MLNIVVELLFAQDDDWCCINDCASLNLTGSKHPTPCTREFFSHESALPLKSNFKTIKMAGGGGREKFSSAQRGCALQIATYLLGCPESTVSSRLAEEEPSFGVMR